MSDEVRQGQGTCISSSEYFEIRKEVKNVNQLYSPPSLTDVLIVDDDEVLVSVYTEYLADSDLRVRSITQPDAALEQVARFSPRSIVVDLNMPRMNGIEFLENAGKSLTQMPPCILASAYSEMDYQRAMRAGVSLVLRKPFRFERLALVLRSTIGMRTGTSPRKYVRVPMKGEVSISGLKFNLTDLGIGGMAVFHAAGIPIAPKESVQIILRDTLANSICLNGFCAWVLDGKMGVEFNNLDDQQRLQVLLLASQAAQTIGSS